MRSAVLFLTFAVSCFALIDESLKPGAKGANVVQDVLEKIDASCVFAKNKQMLRNIAQAETQNGGFNVPDGGIWNVTTAMFQSTQNNQLSVFTSQFPSKFRINWNTVTWNDLRTPLYSALAARLAIALNQDEQISDQNTPPDGKLPWSTTDQAAIWKAVYSKPDDIFTVRRQYNAAVQAVQNSACRSRQAEIAFVFDSSGSILVENFRIMKQFAQGVIDAFDIGPAKVQFGVVSYSSNIGNTIRLDQYHDKNQLKDAVGSISYQDGGTATNLGLEYIRANTFASGNGARPAAAKLAVVLTDGQSDSPTATAAQAKLIHDDQKIGSVLAVGIGSSISASYATELRTIASEPKCMNVFQLRHFADLVQAFALEIKERICNEATTLQLGTTWTDSYGYQRASPPIPFSLDDQNEYISTCVRVPVDNPSTVTVNLHEGAINVYLSYTSRRPSQSAHDAKINLRNRKKQWRLPVSPLALRQHQPDAVGTAFICLGFEIAKNRIVTREASTNRNASTLLDLNVVEGIFGECGSELRLSSNQTVEEEGPGYVDGQALGYPRGMRCEWRVQDLSNHYFLVEFPYLNITGNFLDCLGGDHITIASPTPQKNGAPKSQVICGDPLGKVHSIKMYGPLNITFESTNDTAPGYGFSMRITAVPDIQTASSSFTIHERCGLFVWYLPVVLFFSWVSS